MNNSNQIISLLTEIRDLLKPKEKKAVKRFVKPTVCDLRFYTDEEGLNLDPKTFCDFYESKNWFVGKSKMKDWKAAARNWSKRNGKQSNGFDTRSRAKKVSDKLDEIARKDIDQNGFTSELG